MAHALRRIDLAIQRLELWVCMLCLGVVVVTTVMAVFYRYVLRDPLLWPTALGTLALLVMGFVGAAALFRDGGHIAVDVLPERLSPRLQRVVGMALTVAAAVAIVMVAYAAVPRLPLQARMTIPTLGVPRTAYTYPLLWMAASIAFSAVVQVLTGPHERRD